MVGPYADIFELFFRYCMDVHTILEGAPQKKTVRRSLVGQGYVSSSAVE